MAAVCGGQQSPVLPLRRLAHRGTVGPFPHGRVVKLRILGQRLRRLPLPLRLLHGLPAPADAHGQIPQQQAVEHHIQDAGRLESRHQARHQRRRIHGEQHQRRRQPAPPLFGQQPAQEIHRHHQHRARRAQHQPLGLPGKVIKAPGKHRPDVGGKIREQIVSVRPRQGQKGVYRRQDQHRQQIAPCGLVCRPRSFAFHLSSPFILSVFTKHASSPAAGRVP